MVLAPIGLALLLMILGASVVAVWRIAHGEMIKLPTFANTRLYGMFSYAVASWIDLVIVWLWSSRRGISRDVFAFRKPTWSALVASLIGFVTAMYGAPIMVHWLSYVTGGRGPEVRIDFHDTRSVAIYILLFVVTTPITEEILYRGLLVAWLRAVGWKDAAIWLVGSLIFALNHIIPLGFVWATAMIGFGCILFALRLRYQSLSPSWLTHFLFNTQPILIQSLIAWASASP